MKKYHKVTFLPENKTIKVADRMSIFETIRNNNPQNIQLHFACVVKDEFGLPGPC